MNDKLRTTHLARRAVVYLRQSSLRQVLEHPESTTRQYALRERALSLGWPEQQIEVIDEDLGQSGASSIGRIGFQHLAEAVAKGEVGALFALDVSRLSRLSADWYRLLDLCGLADVLIIDEQAIFAPRDYDDRLLLGLKGQMSEAERYWLRLRLRGSMLNKARRGELRLCPPAGYQWDDAKQGYCLEPDEQVRHAISLVFERFRIDGSLYAVMRYFLEQGLQLPVRDFHTQGIIWGEPRYSVILRIIRHPIYAGAYVFGRRQEGMALVNGQVRRRRSTYLPMESWTVCIRDRHPTYISWDEYMSNQQKVHENRPNHFQPDQRGAPREGRALLQGLVICGRCGHRMRVAYVGKYRTPYYECRSAVTYKTGRTICSVISARPCDEAVTQQFLSVVQPPELELSLALAKEAERQAKEVDQQWRLRLERARYEVRLAERRYKAVDPDNRVVARTLEQEWEEKLRELESAEQAHREACRQKKTDLSADDLARILALAHDLEQVWDAPTTTHEERKTLLRMVVREVTLAPVDIPEPGIHLQILWETDTVTRLTIPRRTRHTSCATSAEALAVIGELRKDGADDEEIADELNRRELKTGTGRTWDARRVFGLRHRQKLGIPESRKTPLARRDGLCSVRGVAQRFQVSQQTVRQWVHQGRLTCANGGGMGRAMWFKLDPETIQRLESSLDHPRDREKERSQLNT